MERTWRGVFGPWWRWVVSVAIVGLCLWAALDEKVASAVIIPPRPEVMLVLAAIVVVNLARAPERGNARVWLILGNLGAWMVILVLLMGSGLAGLASDGCPYLADEDRCERDILRWTMTMLVGQWAITLLTLLWMGARVRLRVRAIALALGVLAMPLALAGFFVVLDHHYPQLT